MFESREIIGIDHENRNIKTAGGAVFSASVQPIGTKPDSLENVLEYQDQSYFIGSGVPAIERVDKTENEDYYILTLAALAMELKGRNLTSANVRMGAALPPRRFQSQKDGFKKYLSRTKELHFRFEGTHYHVTLENVYVPHVMRYYSGGNLFAGLFGNSQIVSVAMAQVGNVGGQKFWSWYGFSSREEWCACFVSWCAEQCGLITNGAVPKFAWCPAGVEWFRSNGKWKDRTYRPSAGTIIFFDWDGDGVSDHVGIVEKCENGRVYTVEGNSGDVVRQAIYMTGSNLILGYAQIS